MQKGIAFPFIKRLLSVNDLSADPTDPLLEVILLSRNDPGTGLRVLKTIEHYGLGMTRAIFMQGKSPYEYIPALNIALFLSGEKRRGGRDQGGISGRAGAQFKIRGRRS